MRSFEKLTYRLPKVGIHNWSLHLHNSAILRTTKLIEELRTKKKLWNCDCGPSKFDCRNSATLCSLLPIPLLSSPFSSAQDGFKNQPKIFFNFLFLWKTKTCLKGTVVRDFYLPFFSTNRPDSMAENILKIAGVKLSSCRFEVAGFRKNCDCRIVELRSRSNIS